MEPDFQHPMSPEDFRAAGHQLIDWIADYYKDIEKYPVRSNVEPGYLKKVLPDSAPESGESFDTIMRDVNEHIVPGITHWQHPSYFAFFPSNSSFPAFLGDMLSGTFNVIGFSWITSPACTELETIVLDWLAKLYGLPDEFLSTSSGGGVIQGTASEATVVALLCARARMLEKLTDEGKTAEEILPKLVAFCSDQAHFSVTKGCKIAGLQPEQLVLIKAKPDTDYSMPVDDLKAAIEEAKAQGKIPFFCVATVGSTSSTAIDPLSKIGPICKEHDLWLHVDSAYAGNANVCPEMRWLFNGIEYADSLDTNPHKWLLVNFDCSTMWIKDRRFVLNALSASSEYIRNKPSDSQQVIDYRNWQIPLGRRFRALKLWMMLRSYGSVKIQEYIRHHLNMAAAFEDLVAMHSDFEIVAVRTVALVCFRLKGTNEQNEKLLEAVNSTGETYLTSTVLPGNVYCLRMAIGGSYTQMRHVTAAWELILQKAAELKQ